MNSVSDSVEGLNWLAAEMYKISDEHGFWSGPEVQVNGGGIGVDEDVRLPEKLMLIVSEAAEALDDYRDGRGEDETWYTWDLPKDFPYEVHHDQGKNRHTVKTGMGTVQDMDYGQFLNLLKIHKVPLKPCGIPSEMADIVIRVLDVCGRYGISIEQALREKIEYNRQRAHKHGRTH